eukprot:7377554-Alexandrium_andersonii.AAC.1
MGELERFQMEGAIRDSDGDANEAGAPPAGARPPPTDGASPRTTQLLKDVGEIAWILAAQRVAWERFACGNFSRLARATTGV